MPFHVHQGDDLWLSNRKVHWAGALYYQMAIMGFRFQSSKQMFGPDRGEFLRVLYADGHATGYCIRSIVNYILRPVYNQVPRDPLLWITTISESLCTLARRGINNYILNVIYDADIFFWGKVKAHQADEKPVPLPWSLIAAPAKDGGLGASRPGTLTVLAAAYTPVPTPQRRETPISNAIHTNTTEDWISKISSELPASTREINSNALRVAIINSNYIDLFTAMIDEYKLWL